MKNLRLQALEIFKKTPMPTFGGDLSGLNFNKIRYFLKGTGIKNSWKDVPKEIKKTYDKLGIPKAEQKFLAGVKAQWDSEMVYGSLLKDLAEQGVIFLSMEEGLEKYPDLADMPVEELLKNLSSLKVEEADRTAIRNHGGGHLNHSMFWQYLDPANQKNELLAKEIISTFGSTDEFKKQFTDSATKLFGSGWTWLIRNNQNSPASPKTASRGRKLEIRNLPMQDAPVMLGLQPLLGLDLWEHAYYLKYQNKRPDYVAAWWNVLKLI